MAGSKQAFHMRQQKLATNWSIFGNIIDDYLGIPYKQNGRAVQSVTGMADGIATEEAGLVCTSFVDVVLSRYLYDDAEMQLDDYSFGKNNNIFDQYGLQPLHTKVVPSTIGSGTILNRDKVYGVVFHMKNAWIKKTQKGYVQREPGSRIHVGFLAFHNNRLFLIHASGRKKGVHIVAWQRFLQRFGNQLQNYGGARLTGPKFLSIYRTVA